MEKIPNKNRKSSRKPLKNSKKRRGQGANRAVIKSCMEEKNSKKSYYLPNTLTDVWVECCKPGRDYSPKIAGLMLAGMAINDASLLEKLSKLAHSNDIKYDKRSHKATGKAVVEAKQLIHNALLDAEIQREIDQLGPSKEEFLRLLTQARELASE